MIRVCARIGCSNVLRPHRDRFCCPECEPVSDGIHCVICGKKKPRRRWSTFTCSWECAGKRRIMQGTKHPPELYAALTKMWEGGKTTGTIAKTLNLSVNAVSGLVRRLDLEYRGSPLGIYRGHRRLNDEQAYAIIRSRGVVPTRELADRYGVSRDTIWAIQTGKKPTYPHPEKDCK